LRCTLNQLFSSETYMYQPSSIVSKLALCYTEV